jgi:hypothetical protein
MYTFLFVSCIISPRCIVKLPVHRAHLQKGRKRERLSMNKLNAEESWGLRWKLPGRIVLFQSSRWQLASLATRSHFHLKCRSIKALATPRARVPGVGFSAELAGGAWVTGNEGAASLSGDLHSKRAWRAHRVPVIARVPRYSTLQRLVAPAPDRRTLTSLRAAKRPRGIGTQTSGRSLPRRSRKSSTSNSSNGISERRARCGPSVISSGDCAWGRD